MDIPEGYGLIEGHSSELARATLNAATEAGVDVSEVKSVSDGYLVPKSVLDAYNKSAGSIQEDDVDGDDLDGLDVDDLRKIAEREGVDLGRASSPAGITAKIREARGE